MKGLYVINSHGQKVLGKRAPSDLTFSTFIYLFVHKCTLCSLRVWEVTPTHKPVCHDIHAKVREQCGTWFCPAGPWVNLRSGFSSGQLYLPSHLTVLISLKNGLPLPSQPLVFHVFKRKCSSRFLSGCYIVI